MKIIVIMKAGIGRFHLFWQFFHFSAKVKIDIVEKSNINKCVSFDQEVKGSMTFNEERKYEASDEKYVNPTYADVVRL